MTTLDHDDTLLTASDARYRPTNSLIAPSTSWRCRTYPFRWFELKIETTPEWVEPDWLLPVCNAIYGLEGLGENWDSHGGRRIKARALGSTLEFMLEILPDAAPIPTITPLSSGNVMIEWHDLGVDLEITIGAQGPVHVYLFDHATQTEQELEVFGDYTGVVQAIRYLMDRM